MQGLIAVLLCLVGVLSATANDTPSVSGAVVVNAQPLKADEVRALERRFSMRAQPGRYWYDAVSGAWGFEGGPTMGWVAAGLRLGGPLRADASGGGTGVFINGRELHPLDVWALSQLGPVWRGRWWVDARGFFGPERGPAWGNLWLLVQQRSQQHSPWSGYTRDGKFLGRDANGCMYYQGSSLIGGGALTYAPPGC